MVENYKKHLKELINKEINAERENSENEICNLKSSTQKIKGKTILNVKLRIIGKYSNNRKVKIFSSKLSDIGINIGDTILISDSQTLHINVTGTVKTVDDSFIIVVEVGKLIDKIDFDNCRIDVLVKNIIYNRQLKNLENPRCDKIIRLLLGNSVLELDNDVRNVTFFDYSLNQDQRNAIVKCLNCGNFSLIHGPFDTGKTKTLIELIKQEVNQGHKVLVTAESNTAIDKLGENLIDSEINMTRIGNSRKFSDKMKNYSLENKHQDYVGDSGSNISQQMIDFEIIQNSQVILATNSSAAMDVISNINFDVAIVDEATQATIPSVLIPISKANRFILAGDHKQLPPTIKSNDNGLKKTLFEKLLEKFPQQVSMLKKQYRMNNVLMSFPNKEFYDNKLICDESVKNIKLDKINYKYDDENALIFIDTSLIKSNDDYSHDNSKSYINKTEANIAADFANAFLNSGLNKHMIGIITNYSGQVKLIKTKTEVRVESVDGFQGGEKEVIIISNVRSNDDGNIGFLDEPRRLNVALTRAKKKLIIIGDSNTLCSKHMFKRLFDFCKKNGVVIQVK